MERFTELFGGLLLFVYHGFERIVINGYLSGLSRPEQVVHFFRELLGVPVLSKEAFSQRTTDYQTWVEAFARNHHLLLQWAQKGVRKEDHVLPWSRRMRKKGSYGVYFIFKSMEQGPTFRISVPKYPAKDPNHRILAPRAQPLHPRLLLHLRRSAWADRDARGVLLALPGHLLPQWPLLHRTRAQESPGRFPQER